MKRRAERSVPKQITHPGPVRELCGLPDATTELVHDLLLRITTTIPPLPRIAQSPVWKDTTSVVEASVIAEFPSEF